MGHSAWKQRERQIALACGQSEGRFPSPHGPDFLLPSRCGDLLAEVKLRKRSPTVTLERWLSNADVLFTCAGGQRTSEALVTMRLHTFLRCFQLPVENDDVCDVAE